MGTARTEPRPLGGRRIHVVAAIATALVVVLALGAGRAAAAPLKEFKLPAGTTATSLIDGPGGTLWFGEATSAGKAEIGRITPAGKIKQIKKGFLPGAQIHALATGAKGTIWFSDTGTTKALGKVSRSGKVTETKAGEGGLDAGAVPYDLTTAPNGTVWFEDLGTPPGVGAIGPSGKIREYPDTSGMPLTPRDLTVDAKGNAWYTRQGGAGIGEAKLAAPTGTPVSLFSTGTTMANGIAAGHDRNLWYTGNGMPVIGRLTPGGTDTEFGVANGLQAGAEPDAITAGPGRDVWFDDQQSGHDAVGKATPSGQITEFPLSGTPWDLTEGIDKNVWLPQGDPNGIDRVTRSGAVSFFTKGLKPGAMIQDGTNIVSGPDGNLWFLDEGTPNAIVRAAVQLTPRAATGGARNITGSSARVTGTANPRGAATKVTIRYGTSPSLRSTASAGSLAPSNARSSISAKLTGLPPGTVVYYRLRATNAYGAAIGKRRKLRTAG
jgi:streptogramin lyase